MTGDRRGREVLVFIATEMIPDAYNLVGMHLSKNELWMKDGKPAATCTSFCPWT